MKVFISWSGQRSHAFAQMLADWMQCVLQSTRPWLSSRDIDRGALWFSEIHNELMDATVGIVCLTQDNKNNPWILFEAGAIAKGLSTSRVCTFLIDLKPSDVKDPLAQFNHTVAERESVWKLVRTLNNALEKSLDERILWQVFNTYWEQFASGHAGVLEKHPAADKAESREPHELLPEILENTRSLSRRLADLEAETRSKRTVLSRASDPETLSGDNESVAWQRARQLAASMLKSRQPLDAVARTLHSKGLTSEEVKSVIEDLGYLWVG